MTLLKKNIWWLVCIFCFLLFIVLAIGVSLDKFEVFDKMVYDIIRSFDFTDFWKFITAFASPLVIISELIFLLIILSKKRHSILLLLNTFNVFIINQILKFIFSRERPLDLMIISESGYSFPSGHTMVALAFYGFLIYIIWKMNLSNKIKKLVTILIVVLIILIGISRIYLGVHYPSDVLAGYAISIAYLIIFIKLVKKYEVGK